MYQGGYEYKENESCDSQISINGKTFPIVSAKHFKDIVNEGRVCVLGITDLCTYSAKKNYSKLKIGINAFRVKPFNIPLESYIFPPIILGYIPIGSRWYIAITRIRTSLIYWLYS